MKYLLIVSCILLFSCVSSEERAARQAKKEALKKELEVQKQEFERLARTGQCDAAETIAEEIFSGNHQLNNLAWVSSVCRNDKRRAIAYLTVSARDNNRYAIKKLISLGVTPPEPTKKTVTKVYNNSTTYKRSTRTVPSRNANMNKCIQDGGSLMCYNRNATNRSGMITPGLTPYGN